MRKVKWGIISTADIGVAKVIPGMLKSGELEVVGDFLAQPQARQGGGRQARHPQGLWLL